MSHGPGCPMPNNTCTCDWPTDEVDPGCECEEWGPKVLAGDYAEFTECGTDWSRADEDLGYDPRSDWGDEGAGGWYE